MSGEQRLGAVAGVVSVVQRRVLLVAVRQFLELHLLISIRWTGVTSFLWRSHTKDFNLARTGPVVTQAHDDRPKQGPYILRSPMQRLQSITDAQLRKADNTGLCRYVLGRRRRTVQKAPSSNSWCGPRLCFAGLMLLTIAPASVPPMLAAVRVTSTARLCQPTVAPYDECESSEASWPHADTPAT